jgi:hypothetical protein
VCETLADCSLYGVSQYRNEKVHYYRVKFETGTKVPMILVDLIRKQTNPTPAQTASTLGGSVFYFHRRSVHNEASERIRTAAAHELAHTLQKATGEWG